MSNNSKTPEFEKLQGKLTFNLLRKAFPTEGNLAWEYNPLRNYRLSKEMFEYRNSLYSREELKKHFNITIDENKENWVGIELDEELPILREPGELVDFITDELLFNINNPVDLLPLYSYDNSVNLIINDGKNFPRLINTRFSPIGKNRYKIVDRLGDLDTNIYDLGEQFDIDTSLYKKTSNIPKVIFKGVSYGGNMKIGNYFFYFVYVDSDGNETPIVEESGLVSLFIGDSKFNIRLGFRDENCFKKVEFELKNIDSAYSEVRVYYSRYTGDINENYTVSNFRILNTFKVTSKLYCYISITGYEDVEEISDTELNKRIEHINSAETLVSCLNRLFLANITKPDMLYLDLADIALRFLPTYTYLNYETSNWENLNATGYYTSDTIYNNVGYEPGELYRLGIVFILPNNVHTPVFNIRGKRNIPKYDNISEIYTEYTELEVKHDGERVYIKINNENLIESNIIPQELLENSKGVISILDDENDPYKIFGIKIVIPKDVMEYLLDILKIKGFYFVRQKRIPLKLCLAYTIGIDPNSNTPLLPIKETSIDNGEKDCFITEGFLTKGTTTTRRIGFTDVPITVGDRELTHTFSDRVLTIPSNKVRIEGALCPDYVINLPYYNSLFNGLQFSIKYSRFLPESKTLKLYKERLYYTSTQNLKSLNNHIISASILGVEDNVKLVTILDKKFSSRAGEAELAFDVEFIERENKTTKNSKLLRGIFGPYLAILAPNLEYGKMIDIYIPNYDESYNNFKNYFYIRYNDSSAYYAISRRFPLVQNDLDLEITSEKKAVYLTESLFRGDTYICDFTLRIIRNFADPSAPINDKIVDPNTWKDNFEYDKGILNSEKLDKINLGDVNAVKLGIWVRMLVRSANNLNIRAIDDSIPDESSLFGHPRIFYPYLDITTEGSFKIPESFAFNKGYTVGLSQIYNMSIPEVPTFKDEFSNRIMYSDIAISDAFKNGFRTFDSKNFRDYSKKYGLITKLVELQGNLLCVLEHGILLIPVNERTVAGEGSGGLVYINTNNVLPENPKVISDTFGSQWKESIIQTPRGVYGVDTIGKKIWKTNGENFECISDFKIQEFLNKNISLSERELEPIIGIRNVKTHYNKFKGDIMFTFYDNLHGFEEKVWNICYNENLQKWITFYSWVPSYSENIYNLFFSFDRNTSKWISKLGISNSSNYFSDGITLDNVIIDNDNWSADIKLRNRNIPSGDGIITSIEYILERDPYKNYEKFTKPELKRNEKGEIVLDEETNLPIYTIKLNNTSYQALCSELYAKECPINNDIYILDKPGSEDTTAIDKKTGQRKLLPLKDDGKTVFTLKELYNQKLKVYKDDRGRKINLINHDNDFSINGNNPVIYLNLKAVINVIYKGSIPTVGEAYTQGFTNGKEVDSGYYLSTIAIIPKYNLLFLTTDFWKHGLTGIIDIADLIYPTYWYGKQHPFEFEFTVADVPDKHKIFDNLEIISNKAEPESFHYEIVGECYDFAKDKKNMYIRQEATKELYLYNGSSIVFDSDYKKLKSEHRLISESNPTQYDKSTIFPLYYSRQDTINEIEDSYHLFGHKDKYGEGDLNFSALAGAEIVRYKNLDEYRIWNHAKAVDISEEGLLRGNMRYKEDKWNVLINPLNIVLKNEDQNDWLGPYGATYQMVPAEYNLFPVPKDIEQNGALKGITLPEDWERNIISWPDIQKINKEAKMKDKFIKIRIRYSGKNLAIISAIQTLYSISCS